MDRCNQLTSHHHYLNSMAMGAFGSGRKKKTAEEKARRLAQKRTLAASIIAQAAALQSMLAAPKISQEDFQPGCAAKRAQKRPVTTAQARPRSPLTDRSDPRPKPVNGLFPRQTARKPVNGLNPRYALDSPPTPLTAPPVDGGPTEPALTGKSRNPVEVDRPHSRQRAFPPTHAPTLTNARRAGEVGSPLTRDLARGYISHVHTRCVRRGVKP